MQNLTLIEGGKQLSQLPVAWNRKHDQLDAIVWRAMGWQRGFPTPRGLRQFGAALGLVMAVVLVASLSAPRNDSLFVVTLALVCGFLGSQLVKRLSDAPSTHAEHVEQLLEQYSPVSRDDYRALQARMIDEDALTLQNVLQWERAERKELVRLEKVAILEGHPRAPDHLEGNYYQRNFRWIWLAAGMVVYQFLSHILSSTGGAAAFEGHDEIKALYVLSKQFEPAVWLMLLASTGLVGLATRTASGLLVSVIGLGSAFGVLLTIIF